MIPNYFTRKDFSQRHKGHKEGKEEFLTTNQHEPHEQRKFIKNIISEFLVFLCVLSVRVPQVRCAFVRNIGVNLLLQSAMGC